MMKRVFLDTNIMLDLAMHREHFDAAFAIMKGAYEGYEQADAAVVGVDAVVAE